MKIFNIETKIGRIIWSVLTSILLNAVIIFFFSFDRCYKSYSPGPFLGIFNDCLKYAGIPFFFELPQPGAIDIDTSMPIKIILDILFWTAVFFIILTLVQYFRNKKASQSKVN
jgi:hypothetical protein